MLTLAFCYWRLSQCIVTICKWWSLRKFFGFNKHTYCTSSSEVRHLNVFAFIRVLNNKYHQTQPNVVSSAYYLSILMIPDISTSDNNRVMIIDIRPA